MESCGEEYTMHLFPHLVKGEGHYVALISSGNQDKGTVKSSHISYYRSRGYKAVPEIEDFLSHVSGIDKSKLELSGDKLFLLPEECPDVKGLRIMRQGVYLGELKKKRFEPSQSFAMILKYGDFDNTISLKSDGNAVSKYLRGETLDIDLIDEENGEITKVNNGWVLICVDRFPLGFGKVSNGIIKNKYLPGWRMV